MKRLLSTLLAGVLCLGAGGMSFDTGGSSGGVYTVTMNPGDSFGTSDGVPANYVPILITKLKPNLAITGSAQTAGQKLLVDSNRRGQIFQTPTEGLSFSTAGAELTRVGMPDGGIKMRIETYGSGDTDLTGVTADSGDCVSDTFEAEGVSQPNLGIAIFRFSSECNLTASTKFKAIIEGDATYEADTPSATNGVFVWATGDGNAPCAAWTYATRNTHKTGTSACGRITESGAAWVEVENDAISMAFGDPQVIHMNPGKYEGLLQLRDEAFLTITGTPGVIWHGLTTATSQTALWLDGMFGFTLSNITFVDDSADTITVQDWGNYPALLVLNHNAFVDIRNTKMRGPNWCVASAVTYGWNRNINITGNDWRCSYGADDIRLGEEAYYYSWSNVFASSGLDRDYTGGAGVVATSVVSGNSTAGDTTMDIHYFDNLLFLSNSDATLTGYAFGISDGLGGNTFHADNVTIYITGNVDTEGGCFLHIGNNAKAVLTNVRCNINNAGSTSATTNGFKLTGNGTIEIYGGSTSITDGGGTIYHLNEASTSGALKVFDHHYDRSLTNGTITDLDCTQVLQSSANPTEAGATNDYLSLLDHAGSTTENNEDDFFTGAAAVIVNNLRCVTATAPGVGNDDWKMTVRTGAAGSLSDTTVTCSIDEAATSCTDVVNSAAIAAGNAITIGIDSSGAASDPAASALISCAVCLGQ